MIEKRLLQAAVAIACLVPLTYGALGVMQGPGFLRGTALPAPADLDSHFRYLSGIFLCAGLWFVSCVPNIERKGSRLRLLGSLVVLGGLARIFSIAQVGLPGSGHIFGLGMELGVVPLLMLWQARVARRMGH